MLSIPPRISSEKIDLMGKIIKARGVLNDQGEFNVNVMEIVGGKDFKVKGEVGPTPEKDLEKKAQDMVDTEEVKKLETVLGSFGAIQKEDLAKWHEHQKLRSPLSLLMARCGVEEYEDGGKIYVKLPTAGK